MGQKKQNKKTMPIKYVLFGIFILGLAATIFITGLIIFTNWSASARDAVAKNADQMNREIVSQVEEFMSVPVDLLTVNQGLVERGIINLEQDAEREPFFVNALKNSGATELYSFSYGSASGEYYGARKNTDNAIEIMKNNSSTGGNSWYYSINEDLRAEELVVAAGKFDPRTRHWYQMAEKTGRISFSPVYKHFIKDDLTVSVAAPIYGQDKQLRGVLGAHVILTTINEFLNQMVKDNQGYAFLVEEDSGYFIANSYGAENFQFDGEKNLVRLSVLDSEELVPKEIVKQHEASKADTFFLDSDNQRYHVRVARITQEGLNWVVYSAVPEEFLIAGIMQSIRTAILLTGLVVLMAAGIFLLITNRLVLPVKSLLRTNERFIAGDFSQRALVERQDEIGSLASSFNQMADMINEHIEGLEGKVQERTLQLAASNQELDESKKQLQLILDSTAEAIYGLDATGACTFINTTGVEMLGYESQEELIGKNMHDLIHHKHKDGNLMKVSDCKVYKSLQNGVGIHADDEVFWKKDGSSFSVEYYSYPQILKNQVVGAVVTFMDNSHRKQMEEDIYLEKEQFRTTLLSVGDAVISTDKDGRILIMNPIAEELTGWTQQEVYGKPLASILKIVSEDTGLGNHNTQLISKKGNKIDIEESSAPIRNSEGEITGVVVVFRDTTEKRDRQRQIEYLSFHDALTGCYNRHYMEDATRRLDIERNLPFSVMMLDVNGLKLVNDAFGHQTGDQLLQTVARVIQRVCRGDEIIGRVGGDEFCVLLPKTDKLHAEEIRKRIRKALSAEKMESIVVSVAIGIATKTVTVENIDNVKIMADNNMYKDKLLHGKAMRSETMERVLQDLHFRYEREQAHGEKVADYCEAIALAMDLTGKEIHDVKRAGMLHDIGKIIIPPEVLSKGEGLTAQELELIKRHPEIGYQILRSVDEYSHLAEEVLYHHERVDGTGYPEGLKGDSIPRKARILAVAEAFEAMTAESPYHVAKTREEAANELLRCAGTQFDEEIVRVFVERVINAGENAGVPSGM